MKPVKNVYWIGARVSWNDYPAQNLAAGAGRVDAIMLGGNDKLTYRIERDKVESKGRSKSYHNQYELLQEDVLEPELVTR